MTPRLRTATGCEPSTFGWRGRVACMVSANPTAADRGIRPFSAPALGETQTSLLSQLQARLPGLGAKPQRSSSAQKVATAPPLDAG